MMQIPILDQITKFLDTVAGNTLYLAAAAAVVIVVLWFIVRLLKSRRRASPLLVPDLKIDIAALGEIGPPPGPPTLEFYNLPVRLAAVVLAPAGRLGELPLDDQLAPLLEAIAPGLEGVAKSHAASIRRWPVQVSPSGFAHLLFNNAKLPGDGGRGTPWSAVAGVFKLGKQSFMAGLLLRAEKPNSLGQTIIDEDHKWLGCLRVRWN